MRNLAVVMFLESMLNVLRKPHILSTFMILKDINVIPHSKVSYCVLSGLPTVAAATFQDE